MHRHKQRYIDTVDSQQRKRSEVFMYWTHQVQSSAVEVFTALIFPLSASVQTGLLSQTEDYFFKTVTSASGDTFKVTEHEGQMEDISKAFWFRAIAYPLELLEETLESSRDLCISRSSLVDLVHFIK